MTKAPNAKLKNIFPEGASFAFFIATLRSLGIGKMHPIDKAVAKVQLLLAKHLRKTAGPKAWKEFMSAEKRPKMDEIKRAAILLGMRRSGYLPKTAIKHFRDISKHEAVKEAGYSVRFDGKKIGLFKLGK